VRVSAERRSPRQQRDNPVVNADLPAREAFFEQLREFCISTQAASWAASRAFFRRRAEIGLHGRSSGDAPTGFQ